MKRRNVLEKEREVYSCFSLLEYETYDLYYQLQKKLGSEESTKGVILFIALDSYKHHLLYEELAEKNKANEERCAEHLGEIFLHSLEATRRMKERISSLKHLDEQELKGILKELSSYERDIYEEAMSSALLSFLTKGERRKETVILELIKQDEQRHEDLLKKSVE